MAETMAVIFKHTLIKTDWKKFIYLRAQVKSAGSHSWVVSTQQSQILPAYDMAAQQLHDQCFTLKGRNAKD